MSIQSLGGVYGPPGVIPRAPEPAGTEETLGRKGTEGLSQPGEAQQPPTQTQAAQSGTLSVEAPAGTDPDLWSVLTADERRYFAKAKALGPVVYSPGKLGLADVGLQRGGRLDVKA